MNFNVMLLLLIALVIVLVLVVFLSGAMKSMYSVNVDFKMLMCDLHIDMQPNDIRKNKLNKSSKSKLDKTIKK